MKYTVIWNRAAEEDLAFLWNTSSDRNAITLASNQIDQLLQFAPDTQGELKPDGRRILIVPPLSVFFKVREEDRIAVVYSVWRYHKTKK